MMENTAASLAGPARERADAFSRLLVSSQDRAFRLAAVILGNPDEAEDPVADAALRAWQHVVRLRDPRTFDAWFCRIVVNVCRDRLRGRKPIVYLTQDPPGLFDAFEESDERAALMGALAKLTPQHRAVVALHYLEGLTTDEIAARIGVPAGTVKSRLHYGVAAMRAAYDAAGREGGGGKR
jgi:RNA polymerase sigma-70 factor (ECF subfamily)